MKFEIFNRFHENIDQDSKKEFKDYKARHKLLIFQYSGDSSRVKNSMDLFIIDSNPDKV